jgi:hypothetical protein
MSCAGGHLGPEVVCLWITLPEYIYVLLKIPAVLVAFSHVRLVQTVPNSLRTDTRALGCHNRGHPIAGRELGIHCNSTAHLRAEAWNSTRVKSVAV